MSKSDVIAAAAIERSIYSIRGHRVMLDADLAVMYGVTTGNLNLAVKRNAKRFPVDFMFQVTAEEGEALRSQTVTSKGRGGRRKPATVFTEQGVAMLSSVLRTERAMLVNVETCGHSFTCGTCWLPTPILPGDSIRWKVSTTSNSV